jgi:hypothetical protein
MERQSNLHSPRIDDEMEHEVESLLRGAPVESRIDESRVKEDAGEGEPVPQSLVTELPDAEAGDEAGGGLSHGDVAARSELAIHLRPSIFPATRDDVLACAEEEHAPEHVVGQLRVLPDGEFGNVQEVWEALGGKREESSGHVPREGAAATPPPARAATTPAPPATGPPHDLRFEFRFDGWYRLAAIPFGVGPGSAHVEITTADDGVRILDARYGPWRVKTPVSNVASTAVTGPYSPLKTIGPAHVSLHDLGLTFASNGQRGLCIRFRRWVPGVAPTGLLRHPGLTVTVDDVEGLARALDAG